jgi:hypothetical protein
LRSPRGPIALLLLLPALSSPAAAPAQVGPPDPRDLERIRDAALASDYAFRFTAHLTDAIGPRLSGSPQYAEAARWVAAELRRLGLEVRLEKVMVPHWVRGEETAALVSWSGMAPGTTQRLAVTALGSSVATPPEGTTADVVVAKDLDELAALPREKVQGRIVVVGTRFDRRLAEAGAALDAYSEAVGVRSRAPREAGRLGAAAVLIRSVGGAEYRLPHTGDTRYAKDVPRIPAGALAAEDADLVARLARQGPVRLRLLLTPRTFPDVEAYSVVGDLPGAVKPGEVVVLAGHLDSWDLGTGALDDAAGLAQAVDAVRVVKELGLRPRRTLRVVAWANEENGVRGGRAYARVHDGELGDHQAALESDLGAGHPLGLTFDGDPSIARTLEPVARALRPMGAGLVRAREGAGTDLIPMWVRGVPAFAPLPDMRTYFDYHHTAADTLDKVDPQSLREGTAVMAVLGYFLAAVEARLPQRPRPMPEWMREDG